MIHALEQHLAAWAGRELAVLAASSGLFAGVTAVAGAPAEAAPNQTGVTVCVWVAGVAPAPAHRGMGMPPVTAGPALDLDARLTIRVEGPAADMPPAAGREFTPAGAATCQADLIALTLLALLQEQAVPQPDGPGAVPPEPAGSAAVSEGTRRAEFSWWQLQGGEPALQTTGSLRRWEIPLTARCTFRLSPAPLEGGRIQHVRAGLEVVETMRRSEFRVGG